MSEAILNGVRCDIREGATVLELCQQQGVPVPTLCHDPRLAPVGVCRLCLVGINGSEHLQPACHTRVISGMVIETETPAVVENRKAVLELLAANYPTEAIASFPDKPFHQLLKSYGISGIPWEPGSSRLQRPRFQDATHPYLHADLNRCIDCFRCVRICHELQGSEVWHAVERGAETEIRPGLSPTLLASDCVSCGACVDTCPTGALEDQSVLKSGPAQTWTRTVCPYCGTGCEMEIGTRGGEIVQIRPRLKAPVNRGHLCVKGRYAYGFYQAGDRIVHPMIREEGQWRTVSWNEAVSFTAKKLKVLLEAHGPDAFGMLGSARGTNEENYLAQKFARVVAGTHNVDCCARVCHAPTAAAMKEMLGTGAATNSFEDIEHAAGFLLCGTNPLENHPIVGARIRQAVRRGARLVILDPRKIELTAEADVHLALRPGTNVPLLNAMAFVLLEEELYDADYVGGGVEGLEQFRNFLRPFSPESVAELCGVSPESIREAARCYASCRPAMSFHGLGTTEHSQGTDGVKGLVNLALLTGNLGKRGAGVNPLRGQNNVQGSAHMGCEPNHLTGFVGVEEGRARLETLWQTSLPRGQGKNLVQMIEAAGQGSLKALWAIGYDIALSHPDNTATRAALASLDLVVVQDLFLTELAREHGTVFLPAASSYEKEGTFMNSERRVQRIRPAVAAPGEARPDWQILCDIAQAMGHTQGFQFHSAAAIWEEIREAWPAGRGISYARLESEGLQWPCLNEEDPGTTMLHGDLFASGHKVRLAHLSYHPTAEQTSDDYPMLLITGRTLHQFNAGTMTLRTPNVELRREDTLDLCPTDAHRLHLHSGERVRLTSRHGSTELPVRITEVVKPGEVFATFHTPDVLLNRVTSGACDPVTQTPEYKVVAVRLEKLSPPSTPSQSTLNHPPE